MAWTSGGSLGTRGNATANQASSVLTTTRAIAASLECAVLVISVDNFQTTDGDEGAVSSISDSAGGTWEKIKEHCNGQGAAQAGVTCSMWLRQPGPALALGGTVTVNFTNATSRDASAMTGWVYGCRGGPIQIVGTNQNLGDASTGTSLAALDVATPNEELLRVRGISAELNSATAPTATLLWTLMTTLRSSNSAAAVHASAEFHISTAAGDASDFIHTSTADWATVYGALRETAPNYSLTATALAVGSPVADAPAVAQAHALVATSVAVASPELGAPALSEQVSEPEALPLIVGSPVIGSVAISQRHALAPKDTRE
jgi:hypothetical protein